MLLLELRQFVKSRYMWQNCLCLVSTLQLFGEITEDAESRVLRVVWDAEVILSTFALSLLYRPQAENT